VRPRLAGHCTIVGMYCYASTDVLVVYLIVVLVDLAVEASEK